MKNLLVAFLLGFLFLSSARLCGQEQVASKLPRWDARGLGPLPRMGITSLDVSDDGKEIVVAAGGQPFHGEGICVKTLSQRIVG